MKINGFTLIELSITLFLVVAVSLWGICSYSSFLQKNEQQVIIDELKAMVRYAKIQALIHGSPVILSPLDGQEDWSHGARLVTKNNSELLYQWQWNHSRWSLLWRGVHSSGQIIFSDSPANAMTNGRFILASKDTHCQVTIILNRLGRLRVLDPPVMPELD